MQNNFSGSGRGSRCSDIPSAGRLHTGLHTVSTGNWRSGADCCSPSTGAQPDGTLIEVQPRLFFSTSFSLYLTVNKRGSSGLAVYTHTSTFESTSNGRHGVHGRCRAPASSPDWLCAHVQESLPVWCCSGQYLLLSRLVVILTDCYSSQRWAVCSLAMTRAWSPESSPWSPLVPDFLVCILTVASKAGLYRLYC